jgi:hypothetical protein
LLCRRRANDSACAHGTGRGPTGAQHYFRQTREPLEILLGSCPERRPRSAHPQSALRNRLVSFDLFVLSGARPLDADAARDAYRHVASGAAWNEVLQEDPRVAQFSAAFMARWPDTVELEASPAHLILSIPGSALDEVLDFCEATAVRMGLNLFDPQDGTLYSPGRPPRKATPVPRQTLICQRCGRLIEPGRPYVEAPRLLHPECLAAELRAR